LLVEDAANPDSTPFVVTAAGDVGIGTSSPADKLQVLGTIRFGANASYYGTITHDAGTTGANIYNHVDAGGHLFQAGGTTLMNLTASGNLGLGVTPSAWASTYRAYQVGQAGSLFGLTNDQDRVGVSSNAYFDTTDSRWEYIGTGYAMRYDQNAGEHQWYTAASGAANGAITFTQAMTLDASGNLLVGTTTNGGVLTINGSSNGASRIRLYNQTTELGALGSYLGYIGIGGANDLLLYGSANMFVGSNGYVAFTAGGSTERARITSEGMFQVDSAVSNSTALSTTNPFRIYTGTSTFTDTGAAGTRTHGTIVAFDNPAIAATNAVTYTNASTVYIDGAPTAGTNVTLTNAYALYVNAGNVSAAGVYTATVGGTNRDVYVDSTGLIGYVSSTRASKTNITNITDANWLLQLNPVSFNYRKKDEAGNYTEEADGPIEFGLIAEDTEAIKPELCFYDDVDGKQELRGISYSKLITPMLKLLQEQQALITSLTARVAALEGTQP
jgi:hypothetical protein